MDSDGRHLVGVVMDRGVAMKCSPKIGGAGRVAVTGAELSLGDVILREGLSGLWR